MYLTLIAIHKTGKQLKDIQGFRILDSDSGDVRDIPYKSVVNTLMTQNVTVDGIDISSGVPKGSNGSFDRYTQLANNITIGKCPVVIVKEYPGKVYDVANHLGQVAKMNMQSIISFSASEGIANGKIVETENGKYISSISGEYPKDKSFKDLANGDRLKAKMAMIGSEDIELDDNNFVKGLNKQLDEIGVGKGCLGIAPRGFADFINLKTVHLPNTCTHFGVGAFMNCEALEEIKVPDGTVLITKRCFEGCKSLKHIVLPNSIRKIENGAFKNSGVTEVSLGPVKPEMSSLSFPPRAKIIVRR